MVREGPVGPEPATAPGATPSAPGGDRRRAGGGPGPRSAAPAPRPTVRGFLDFSLVLIGVAALIAGTVNARRHDRVAGIRGERDRLERERVDLEASIDRERRFYEGIEEDPILLRELLDGLFPAAPEEGIPLGEWLHAPAAAPLEA